MLFHLSPALSLLILCNICSHLQAVRNNPELWSYHKPQLNKVEPTFDSQHENNTSTTNLQSSPDRLHPRALEVENQSEDITTTIISGEQAMTNVQPTDVETSQNRINSNESNQQQPISEHLQDENNSSSTESSQSEEFEDDNNEEEPNGFHPVLTVGSGMSNSFSSQGDKQDEFLRIDSSAPSLEPEAASTDDDSQLESSTPIDNEDQSTDQTFVVVEGSTSPTFNNVDLESSTNLEPLIDGSGNFETESQTESSGNVELLTDDSSGDFTIVDGSGDSSQILEGSADEPVDYELIKSGDTNASASAEMEDHSSEENPNSAESNTEEDYDNEDGETTQNLNTAEVEADGNEENLHSTSEQHFQQPNIQPEQSTDLQKESEEIYTTTDEAKEVTEIENPTVLNTKSGVTLNGQPEPNTAEESEASSSSSSEEPEQNGETLVKSKQQEESQQFTKTSNRIISNEETDFTPSTKQAAENNNHSSILKQPSQRGMMSFASIFRPTAFLHSSSKKSRRKMNWPQILQQLGFFNGFYRKKPKKESRVKINANSRETEISSEKLKTVTVHRNLEKQEHIEEFHSTQSFLTTESTTPIESISPEALEMQRITMQEVMDDFFQSGQNYYTQLLNLILIISIQLGMLEWHNQTKGIFNGKMYTHCGEELHPINIVYRMLKRKGIFDEYQQSKCHVDYHIHCKYSWKYCDSMEALTFCPKTCKQHICDKPFDNEFQRHQIKLCCNLSVKLYGYDGSETPTYRKNCQDTKQHDCKELSERGDCFTNPGSMALLCPESCQFCSFDEMYLPFMPEAEKLAIWLKMYKNGTYNAYAEYMTSRIKAIHNKAKQGLC
ncbi:hypothetical protein T4D_4704 [Trichinella pseudospiralis]|uniref:ShKT domain-containing protein n=1 Tax=Trichinella pseudospiralis TaxID=6337 RepID=A0A0V1FSC1_TRIPS|nr:hypothetical protein T4D_4704 [Trichinella pseudospiralis]